MGVAGEGPRASHLAPGGETPLAEVFEYADEIVVTVGMPAAAAEAVSVAVEGDLLIIAVEDEPAHHSEVALPAAVDVPRMQVTYEGGVLRVTLPKRR